MDLDGKLQSSYATLPETFYTRMEPNPVNEPQMVKWNEKLAAHLGIKQEGVLVTLGGSTFPKEQVRLRKHMPVTSSAISPCLATDGLSFLVNGKTSQGRK